MYMHAHSLHTLIASHTHQAPIHNARKSTFCWEGKTAKRRKTQAATKGQSSLVTDSPGLLRRCELYAPWGRAAGTQSLARARLTQPPLPRSISVSQN